MAMVLTTGIREALLYAEAAHKTVTVTAGPVTVTGTICSVNPLVVEAAEDQSANLINFDLVTCVCVPGLRGAQLATEIRPKGEMKLGLRPQ